MGGPIGGDQTPFGCGEPTGGDQWLFGDGAPIGGEMWLFSTHERNRANKLTALESPEAA